MLDSEKVPRLSDAEINAKHTLAKKNNKEAREKKAAAEAKKGSK